jgi:hypothetical protein
MDSTNNQTTHDVLQREVEGAFPCDDIFSEDDTWQLALNSFVQANVRVQANTCQWLPSDKDIYSISIDHQDDAHRCDINMAGRDWQWSGFDKDDTNGCLFDKVDSSHCLSPCSSSDSGEDVAPSMPSFENGEGEARLAREAAGRSRPKVRRPRQNRPQKWTTADHEKFLVGLKVYGLLHGLGRGGAEIMAMYMGNRSVLQVKSHMQKYLSDIAHGRCYAA